jgi:hypothetical protein
MKYLGKRGRCFFVTRKTRFAKQAGYGSSLRTPSTEPIWKISPRIFLFSGHFAFAPGMKVREGLFLFLSGDSKW